MDWTWISTKTFAGICFKGRAFIESRDPGHSASSVFITNWRFLIQKDTHGRLQICCRLIYFFKNNDTPHIRGNARQLELFKTCYRANGGQGI